MPTGVRLYASAVVTALYTLPGKLNKHFQSFAVPVFGGEAHFSQEVSLALKDRQIYAPIEWNGGDIHPRPGAGVGAWHLGSASG